MPHSIRRYTCTNDIHASTSTHWIYFIYITILLLCRVRYWWFSRITFVPKPIRIDIWIIFSFEIFERHWKVTGVVSDSVLLSIFYRKPINVKSQQQQNCDVPIQCEPWPFLALCVNGGGSLGYQIKVWKRLSI